MLQYFLNKIKLHNSFSSIKVHRLKHIESLKAELEEALTEKDETQKDMIQLDKVHKKLQREHKEMQSKHEQLCFNFKKLKLEKESSLQERNRLSVDLEASQANASKQQDVEKEINFYKAELKKLNEFKILKLEESRKVKKKEKKLRHKEFPLTPMGVLAPGSAHARPSA